MSTILPRAANIRLNGYEELIKINEDIDDINQKLKKIAQIANNLFVVEQPQFVDSVGKIQDSLLAANGSEY